MLVAEHLFKYFGVIKAVDDVSFSIDKGMIVGILGPNGAGKTTIMRIFTGFLSPTDGKATVRGLDVTEDSVKVRNIIGYLPENNPLYDELTVKENLMFFAKIRGLAYSERKKAIQEAVEKCGLGDVYNRPISELSRGYKQRVGLAQCILHNPEILILDEPTTGLDPKQVVETREVIKALGKEKTVLISSHILPEVSQTCEYILIIDKGKLVAQGSPAELEKLATGAPIIYYRVEANIPDVTKKLSAVNVIKKVEILEQSDNKIARYKLLVTETSKDVCKLLFNLAVENNWSLLELHPENVSLEDVFMKLVK